MRIFTLSLTKEPLISSTGFVLARLAGLAVCPFLMWFRDNEVVRWIGVLLLLGTAVLWVGTFYGALWAHMASFAKWVPPTMGTPCP